jgi:hypothetical protein
MANRKTRKYKRTNRIVQNHSQKIYQVIVYVYTGFPSFMAFHDKKKWYYYDSGIFALFFLYFFTGVNTVFIDKIFPFW